MNGCIRCLEEFPLRPFTVPQMGHMYRVRDLPARMQARVAADRGEPITAILAEDDDDYPVCVCGNCLFDIAE